MSVVSPGSKPRPANEVVFRELTEGAVVLHLGSGQYHGVNPVGAAVWSLLDGRRSVDDIVAELRERIEEPPPQLADDVRAFLAQLAQRGLIEV